MRKTDSTYCDGTYRSDFGMEKRIYLALFLIIFVATYLFVCFGIPGMRIKLDAEPMEYFLKNVSHMVFIKTIISFVATIVVGSIALIMWRKK